jgi:hypothetical protein
VDGLVESVSTNSIFETDAISRFFSDWL